MKRVLCIVLVGGLGSGMLFATGCTSTGQAAKIDVPKHTYVQGMMCPACETVWVKKHVRRGPKISVLRHERKMACPSCDAMARSQLLDDGEVMLHNCPTCKMTPKPIKPVESSRNG